MFHSRRLNTKINSIHERALRITYQDHISTFQELLNKDNSVSIHHRNLQALATEMFKIHRGLSPDILREIFVPKISLYNLRRNKTFVRRQVHSLISLIFIRSFWYSVICQLGAYYLLLAFLFWLMLTLILRFCLKCLVSTIPTFRNVVDRTRGLRQSLLFVES